MHAYANESVKLVYDFFSSSVCSILFAWFLLLLLLLLLMLLVGAICMYAAIFFWKFSFAWLFCFAICLCIICMSLGCLLHYREIVHGFACYICQSHTHIRCSYIGAWTLNANTERTGGRVPLLLSCAPWGRSLFRIFLSIIILFRFFSVLFCSVYLFCALYTYTFETSCQ